ncbi:MAG: tetratricopeptide repeat protein [Selenomonas sp.]|nr:tetratricopeptide repeat protein [Selenomonas sp.]
MKKMVIRLMILLGIMFPPGMYGGNQSDGIVNIANVANAAATSAQEEHDLGKRYLFKEKNYDEAIKHFTKCIELLPTEAGEAFAYPYYYRGRAYKEKGDINKAFADYTLAIQYNAKFAPAYASRSSILYDMQKYDEALKEINEAIKSDQKVPDYVGFRAKCYYKLGKHDKSLPDCNQAIKAEPQWWELYFVRGVSYAMSNNLEKALQDLGVVIDNDTNRLERADAYVWRGAIYNKMGDKEKAKKEIAKGRAMGSKLGQ